MKRGKLLVMPALLWLGIFFALPLLIVVAVSFASRTPYGQIVFHWTVANYARFLEPLYLQIFATTLVTAIITTLLTFALGYPVAYTIAMLIPKKWQQAGIILVMIPFWINFLIRSFPGSSFSAARACSIRFCYRWGSSSSPCPFCITMRR